MMQNYSSVIEMLTLMSDKVKIRYRNVVLMSSDLYELGELKKVIQEKFTTYITMEARTNQDSISRVNFIADLKNSSEEGIIIYFPEDYLLTWSTRDKQAFYSFLSMHSGEVPQIIVLCLDNANFNTANVNYFKPLKKVTISTTLLASNKTDSNMVGIQ